MARQRGITLPETLLRLFLLHVARGYSLRETAVRANQAGLATISDVGILKRLRRSEDWLRWLCTQLVSENGVRMPRLKDQGAGTSPSVRVGNGWLEVKWIPRKSGKLSGPYLYYRVREAGHLRSRYIGKASP